jgi:hypothetical protein
MSEAANFLLPPSWRMVYSTSWKKRDIAVPSFYKLVFESLNRQMKKKKRRSDLKFFIKMEHISNYYSQSAAIFSRSDNNGVDVENEDVAI